MAASNRISELTRRRMARQCAALAIAIGLLAGTCGDAASSASTPAVDRPNIIFILLDDLPLDGLGVDNPVLQTPNIDRLARDGVYVPRAAVTTSLCSPSRATILTGMSTRNHGIVDNTNSSETGLTYFPSYLQQAGYQTAFVGKWHMGTEADGPRRGFDRWVSFAGQGSYLPMGDFKQNVRQTLNVDGRRVDRQDYITDELTDYALDWLSNGRNQDRPFFLYLSHKAVHGPCTPAQRHREQYAADTMTLPASFADTPENNRGRPLWVRNQRNSWHGIDVRHARGTQSMLAERRSCDAALSAVDDSVGRILRFLTDQQIDRRTLVFFFSDNGSMWGAHGLTDKRNAYEESVRVPLIAYGPGYFPAGLRSEARVRNLDLAPTFLDIAGVAAPPHFEGRSVLPLLRGTVVWRDWPQDDFVYEYYWEWSYPMTPTTFSIVRNNLKYIQYHGVWDIEELYDLSVDPHEMRNLINEPTLASVRADLRRRLHEQLADRQGAHRVGFTERLNRGFVFRNARGTPAAEFPPEWQLVPPAGQDIDFWSVNQRAAER